jgi:hypothetical protein
MNFSPRICSENSRAAAFGPNARRFACHAHGGGPSVYIVAESRADAAAYYRTFHGLGPDSIFGHILVFVDELPD